MPTAKRIESEGSIGEGLGRDTSWGTLQTGTDPRRSPPACSKMLKKNCARPNAIQMPAFDSDISPWIENTLATVKRPVQTNLARNGLALSVFFF